MKKLISQVLVVIAALGVVASASAQTAVQGQSKDKSAKFEKVLKVRALRQKKMQEVLGKLNLNSDQKNKIAELKLKDMAELKDLRQKVRSGSMTKEDAMAKRKEIVKSSRESIKGILTPAQDKKFMTMLKEMKKNEKKDDIGKNIPPQ